jgi:isopentenyl-diphosphate delta-isomerase
MGGEDVVTVTEDGERTGTIDRLEAHTGEGRLHLAFTTMVFDTDGNILLARRSPEKRLWDRHWDGTVASHPAEGQGQEEAVRERLAEELGITSDQYDGLDHRDRFTYRRRYRDRGLEFEVCDVFATVLTDRSLDPEPGEVAGLMWVPYDRLQADPEDYRQLDLCPWFTIAMHRDKAQD